MASHVEARAVVAHRRASAHCHAARQHKAENTNLPNPLQLSALVLVRRFGVPLHRAALLAALAGLGGRNG